MRSASARVHVVLVATSVLVAIAGAAGILVLRLTNSGFEPEGRNWWIVAETVLGLAYLPLGTALAVGRRLRLGLAFWRHRRLRAVVRVRGGVARAQRGGERVAGDRALTPGSDDRVVRARLRRSVGVAMAAGAPGWRRDPMTRWLTLGLVAAWAASLAALVDAHRERTGGHRRRTAGCWSRRCRLIAVGAFVADTRDDRSRARRPVAPLSRVGHSRQRRGCCCTPRWSRDSAYSSARTGPRGCWSV